jgi:cell division protein FtsB
MLSRQKIKQYIELSYPYIEQLREPRVAGQVIFVVIVLLISWSGVKAIDANYALKKQISTLQQQNTIQQLENNNQKLQNQYYDSQQYLELSARQDFSLGAPGETELIVPKNVALSYTVPVPKTLSAKPAPALPFYEQNLKDWLDFFLHRQSSTD